MKHKVLFVCIHNSARSQMAEAFLNQLGGGEFEAESAGIEPGTLNPSVVHVMQEADIDISQKGTQSVFELFRKGRMYHAVITVCDEASAERCPIFPGRTKRIGWSFNDPSKAEGTDEEKLAQIRKIRDEIKEKITAFIADAKQLQYWV